MKPNKVLTKKDEHMLAIFTKKTLWYMSGMHHSCSIGCNMSGIEAAVP